MPRGLSQPSSHPHPHPRYLGPYWLRGARAAARAGRRRTSMAIRRWLGQHLPAAAADEVAAMAEAEASRWAGVSLVAKVSPPAARQLQTCGLPLDVPLPLLSEMVSARGQTALRIRTSATVALTHASVTAPRSRQQSPCRRRAPTQGRQRARSGALTLRSSGAARAHRSCDAAAGPAAARAVPGGRGLARPRAAWRHLPRGADGLGLGLGLLAS